MGLRKSTRRFIKYIAFHLRFYRNIRTQNLNTINFADPIILNKKNDMETIPKIIWMYWDSPQTPPLVQKCFDQVKKLHPEYKIHILNSNNLTQFSQFNFAQFNALTPQQKADLLRFDLLYNYGGIWLDASIILYEKIDWILKICQENKTSAFAYYREANITVKEYPVIENWLLATTAKNYFFKAWLDELSFALQFGVSNYIQKIKSEHTNHEEYFQNIYLLEYLIAYVACQKILRTHTASFSLINCDKNAFFYQNVDSSSSIYFIESMILRERPINMPHLIKLIGSDRELISPYLANTKFKPNSLLDFG